MAGSTRELNVTIIFIVTLVSVLLLVAIVLTSHGGYYYFANRQADWRRNADAQRTYDEFHVRQDSRQLAATLTQQDKTLMESGPVQIKAMVKNEETDEMEEKVVRTVEKLPIDQAMKRVAERY